MKNKKWRLMLPTYIREKLKQVKEIRNCYYKKRNEVDRVLLRAESREVKREITKYRALQWKEFLQ